MDVKDTQGMFARIGKRTHPTSLEGVLPSRWRPNLEFTVTARFIEGMPTYAFSLKGSVGQYEPSWLGKMLAGDNVPMCYDVDLVGINWGRGTRTNLLSENFPKGWKDWSPPCSDLKNSYALTGEVVCIKLLSDVSVRIQGTQLDGSNPLFVVEYRYSLAQLNNDARYGIGVKFL